MYFWLQEKWKSQKKQFRSKTKNFRVNFKKECQPFVISLYHLQWSQNKTNHNGKDHLQTTNALNIFAKIRGPNSTGDNSSTQHLQTEDKQA